MIIPDVNMLVYAHNRTAIEHESAREWWEGLLNGEEQIGLAWIVVTGFLRLVTHPSTLNNPLRPASAIEIVVRWFELPHVSEVNPGSEHLKLLGRCLDAVGVCGNLVTDCHIAAIAMEYEAEVHSNDADFGRFPGLLWRNPL